MTHSRDEISAKLQEIEEAIAVLQKAMNGPALEAALAPLLEKREKYYAQLESDGAIAQGDHSTALGKQAVQARDVGGDVVTGSKYDIHGHGTRVEGDIHITQQEQHVDTQMNAGGHVIIAGRDITKSLVNDKSVIRYTDISCPDQVHKDTARVSVIVRLTLAPSQLSAGIEKLLVQKGPVRVRLEASAFTCLNDQEQETLIIPEEDSPAVIFDLRPERVGPTRLTFDFFQGGNPVGTVSVPIEVTADPVSVHQTAKSKAVLRIANVAPPPDFMLYIGYERTTSQPTLTFTLLRSESVGGRTFHPITLQSHPQGQSERLFEKLTVLSKQQDPTTKAVRNQWRALSLDDVDRKLKLFGQNLWHELVPDDFKSVYARERAKWHNKSLLIVSDEPYIPWELIWPYGDDWQDDAPWCITMQLTRWLRRDFQGNGHEAAPHLLPFRALACLAPVYAGKAKLDNAQEEARYLHDLLQEHNLTDLTPPKFTWNNVMDLLEAKTYDWLHVAAHGSFSPKAPNDDSAIWLQDQHPLTPGDFVGPSIQSHIRMRRPGFVLNACHSGRESWAITSIGGWANRLISFGAGLFLGPLWTVADKPALKFTQTFYECLLDGETVAQAVRESRLAARRDGDPSWLAYSVYAHPNARLER